jgi:hypothetical protein
MPSRIFRSALAAALALSCVAAASVQSRRPLPDAELVAGDGTPIKLTALGHDGEWLLLSIHASSTPSQRLLEAMADWGLGGALARVVVIVGSDGNAGLLASQWSERLPGIRWVSDPSGNVARQVGLRGAPAVIGVAGGDIGFILAGVLNDPTMVRDVIKGWLSVP